MDGIFTVDLAIFLLATFIAALVAGLAGFAFGLVAAAIWLHVIAPAQAAALIVGFGLIVQGAAVWRLRRALEWRRLRPFLAGAALGVPLGVAVLGAAPVALLRAGIGALLVLYGIYSLTKAATKPLTGAGARADAGIGLLSGLIGGLTGLGGILPTVWCNLRGWPKDQQRAVFQPVAVGIFVMTALWLGASGAIPAGTLRLFLSGLPALLVGTWFGLALYGRLNDAAFGRIVRVLLVMSGIALMVETR